jgi:hypothetical protein
VVKTIGIVAVAALTAGTAIGRPQRERAPQGCITGARRAERKGVQVRMAAQLGKQM